MSGVETPTGMSSFITSLTTGITSDTLWTEVAKAAPFIIGIFIFALGYRVLKKALKGGYKGKVNV